MHLLSDRLAAYVREQALRAVELYPAAFQRCEEAAVHKARVAIRRARSTLRLFKACFRKGRRKRASRHLAELARRLGPVRDLDALAARVTDELDAELRPAAAGALDLLLHRMAKARRALALDVSGEADPAEAARVLLAVEEVLARTAPGDAHDELRRQARRYVQRSAALLVSSADVRAIESLHGLRIRIKRIRYALEVLAPLVDVDVEPALAAAREAQEGLGRLNDLAVLADFAERMVPEHPQLHSALHLARERRHRDMVAARALDAGLAEHLRPFAATPPLATEPGQPTHDRESAA